MSTHLLVENGPDMGLQSGCQKTILLLSLERIWRALETPQRRNKEDIAGSTFATEANFPDAGARINYNTILCAVERMPTRGLVMRRCLNHS